MPGVRLRTTVEHATMAYHKKNLLEAFQASAAAERARAQESASKDASRAGGPSARTAPQPQASQGARAAGSAQAASPRSSGRAGEDSPAAPRVGWRPDGIQRLILLQVVITVAAFFLGRASVSTVGAGESTADKPVSEPPSEARAQPRTSPPASPGVAQEESRPGTPAESALIDPRNRYTVKLVEYRKGRDDKVALDTLAWLESQGLPAVAKFEGSRLYILLGAAQTQRELDDLLKTAQTMQGPPPVSKPAEFHDAYIVGIDRLGIR